jgi:Fe2+ or Zn2+ uptake regulation protein
LLNRYGVLLREQVAAENVPGGFSAVYDVLKALEESGRIRRGYFVAGWARRSLLCRLRSICCASCARAARGEAGVCAVGCD